MTRRLLASLIVVGLGAGIWLLWPRADAPAPPTTTQPIAVAPTSTLSEVKTSTTRILPSTSTTSVRSHVVETVEEAEAILRELWFGWFEGIYNQDEDRIREVVATEEFVQAGVAAFDTLGFRVRPTRDAIEYTDTQILMATQECLVIWTAGTASFLAGETKNTGVDVVRRVGDAWKTFTTWQFREDLWRSDCDAVLQSS